MAAPHPPKVSEKTLELNVGAEILAFVRGVLGHPHAYLRGLTQKEEKAEGVDNYADWGAPEVIAFQFKAPKRSTEAAPYRFTLNRNQHLQLSALAAQYPNAVFYVFPFYLFATKVVANAPNLLDETWFLRVADVPASVFGAKKTLTVKCEPGLARINPEYSLRSLRSTLEPGFKAAPIKAIALLDAERESTYKRADPWRRRGLRFLALGLGKSDIAQRLSVLRNQGHSSPSGGEWEAFHAFLRDKTRPGQGPPPVPLILAAAGESNASKHRRLGEQLEWALKNGCLSDALAFLGAIPISDWNSDSPETWHRESY